MSGRQTMRADVPIPIDLHGDGARGSLFAGFAADEPLVASHGGPRVAIRSVNAITALGIDATGTWRQLLAGVSIQDHSRLDDFGATGRAARLAELVVRPLLNAGLARDAAVVVGTSKAGVVDWLAGPPPVRPDCPTSDNPAGGVSLSGLGDIAAELGRITRTRGPVSTISAACASGLHALIRGAMMIRSGEVRQALVVAAEASVHPLFLGSFQRLGVLAQPGAGCRPFDRNRTGFYMSEAAAAVLLEAAEPEGTLRSAQSNGSRETFAETRVYLDRFALGGDATHLTGGDPAGRVLKQLLKRVIDDRPLDLVHAHGTGTQMNDAAELAAIEDMVIDQADCPVVYSHKAGLGHSLGASGLLSVVINCMAHTAGEIPPNVRTTAPLPTSRVTIPRTVTCRNVRRSLAMAAGFGGPVAVVSLVS